MFAYIKEKLEILEGFEIILSSDQLSYIMGLKTEISVDNYARDLIKKKLGCII